MGQVASNIEHGDDRRCGTNGNYRRRWRGGSATPARERDAGAKPSIEVATACFPNVPALLCYYVGTGSRAAVRAYRKEPMIVQPKCKRCGRPLSDPVSVAIGIGSECRNGSGGRRKMTKAQTRHLHSISRAVDFVQHKPILFGNVSYRREEKGWTSDGKQFSSDEEFKKWLQRYSLADFEAVQVIEAARV